MDRSGGGSSISAAKPSPASPRSGRASPASASPGEGGLGRSALQDLADRYAITPTRSLGQHFLADPNLARAIVADAAVGSGDRVVEIGAGLGSLTIALAATGCDVVAIEFDRALMPALDEVVGGLANVQVVSADASDPAWSNALEGEGWVLVANLPYNVSVPLLLDVLERVVAIEQVVAMVQREVADRLLASPGAEPYGPLTVRVAWRGSVASVRRVPAEVFWPRPSVESTVVRIDRLAAPPDVDLAAAARVVEVAFAERRKTLANALRRLGLGPDEATSVALAAGLDPSERPERVTPEGFSRLTAELLDHGWAA